MTSTPMPDEERQELDEIQRRKDQLDRELNTRQITKHRRDISLKDYSDADITRARNVLTNRISVLLARYERS